MGSRRWLLGAAAVTCAAALAAAPADAMADASAFGVTHARWDCTVGPLIEDASSRVAGLSAPEVASMFDHSTDARVRVYRALVRARPSVTPARSACDLAAVDIVYGVHWIGSPHVKDGTLRVRYSAGEFQKTLAADTPPPSRAGFAVPRLDMPKAVALAVQYWTRHRATPVGEPIAVSSATLTYGTSLTYAPIYGTDPTAPEASPQPTQGLETWAIASAGSEPTVQVAMNGTVTPTS